MFSQNTWCGCENVLAKIHGVLEKKCGCEKQFSLNSKVQTNGSEQFTVMLKAFSTRLTHKEFKGRSEPLTIRAALKLSGPGSMSL